jgi:hypothetical protein
VVITVIVLSLAISLLVNPAIDKDAQVDEEHVVHLVNPYEMSDETSTNRYRVLQGEVSNEYSVYDGNLIKFTDFPVGKMINTFILEVDNLLFEVEPSDFEKYGGGRMAEIEYLNTDFNYYYEIDSITADGTYIKSEKQRQVYRIISISGDPHTIFDGMITSASSEQWSFSSKEMEETFDLYTEKKDDKLLRGLSPLDVFKFYVKASESGDHFTQYALFIKDPGYEVPSYKTYISEISRDQEVLDRSKQMWANLKQSYGLTEELEGDQALIRISNGNGNKKEEKGFQLIKNKDGIWKVAWMPMQ